MMPTQNNHLVTFDGFLSISLLFSIFFLPNIVITPLFSIRMEDVKIIPNLWFIKVMLLMNIIMFISLGLNDRLISINSFEFYNKTIKGVICYIVFIIYMSNYVNHNQITKVIQYFIIGLIFINFLEMMNISFLSKAFHMYNSSLNASNSPAENLRITGLFGNPNNNGVFLLMLFGHIIDQYGLKSNKFNLFIAFLCVVLIMLTQSRTAVVATVSFFFVFTYLSKRIMVSIMLVVVILVILINSNLNYLFIILDSNSMVKTNSYTKRIEEWQMLFNMIKAQPLFGYGGYKEFFYKLEKYPESEYFLLWFRYGIFYLVIYIYTLLVLLVDGMISANKNLAGGYFMVSSCIAMIICSFSNAPFNNPRIFTFFIFVIAYFQTAILHKARFTVLSQS